MAETVSEESVLIADNNTQSLRFRTLAVLLLCWMVVVVSTVAVLAADLLLVLFLGGLFGVFLVQCAQALSRFVAWNYSVRLSSIVVLLLLLTTGFFTLAGWQFSRHIDEFSHQLGVGMQRVKELAKQYPALDTTLRATPMVRQSIYALPSNLKNDQTASDPLASAQSPSRQPTDDGPTPESPQTTTSGSPRDPGQPGTNSQPDANSQPEGDNQENTDRDGRDAAFTKLANTGRSVFKTTYGVVVNVALVFFIGIFLAVAPQSYVQGVVQLTPHPYQMRCREVLHHIFHTLRHWLIGRFATMAITGLGAALVLWIAGAPMAGTIGTLTGLLAFIPNIGAAIAFGLAVIASLPQGANTVIAVTIGYIVLQLLESYVITPLIQQREVDVLPALLLSVQAIMAVLFGFVGAITASPLLATVRAILQKTYLEEESKPRQDSSLDQPTEKHSQTGEVHSSHLPQGPHQPQGQSEKDPQDNSRQNARHPEVPS